MQDAKYVDPLSQDGRCSLELNNALDIGAFRKDGSIEHHAVRQLSFPASEYQLLPSVKE